MEKKPRQVPFRALAREGWVSPGFEDGKLFEVSAVASNNAVNVLSEVEIACLER